MTQSEIEKVVNDVARDLRLPPAARYELSTHAKRFATQEDATMRADAQGFASRCTNPLLGGAVNLLALALAESRYAESLSPSDRAAHEASMTVVGSLDGDDLGALDEEEAEVATYAASLETKGDATSKTAAERPRRHRSRASRARGLVTCPGDGGGSCGIPTAGSLTCAAPTTPG